MTKLLEFVTKYKEAIGALSGFGAGLLGGIAGFAGGLDSLVRNAPLALWIAIGLFGIGALAIFALEIRSHRAEQAQPPLRAWGLAFALLIFAPVLLGAAAVNIGSSPIRPLIKAEITTDSSGNPLVSGSVKVANLSAADVFTVLVLGHPQALQPGASVQLIDIYRADIGAGTDGRAEATINQRLSAAQYGQVDILAWSGTAATGIPFRSCRDLDATRAACYTLQLPAGALKPQLAAEVTGTGAERAVRVSVHVDAASPNGIILRLVVTDSSQQVISSYDSLIRPDAQGAISRNVVHPIPDVDASICVIAVAATQEGMSPALSCPSVGSAEEPDVAYDWVRMDVHSSGATATE